MKKRIANQRYIDKGKWWGIARLILLSKDLEVFELPLKHLNIYNLHPQITSMKLFVEHMQNTIDADLSFPIILDDEGYVMDGRHRIAKAMLEKKETIKAVRFEEIPEPCGTEEEKGA